MIKMMIPMIANQSKNLAILTKEGAKRVQAKAAMKKANPKFIQRDWL